MSKVTRNFTSSKFKRILIFGCIFIIIASVGLLIYFKTNNFTKKNLYVEEILINGTSTKVKEEVVKHLKGIIGLPIEDIDLYKVKYVVLNIPRIHAVSVTKTFPNIISLHVIEKNPLFIWQNSKDEFYLVNSANRVIRKAKLEEYKRLILIKGFDLPIIMSEEVRFYVFGYPYLLKNVSTLEYNGYRWDMILRNGIVVKLPQDNIEKAIKLVMDMNNKYQILERKISYIDTRVPNKLFIKPEENV